MRDHVPTITFAAAGALLAVVGAVGAVSLFAEWRGAWSSYFLMERTIETAAPVAALLMGAVVVTWGLVVYEAT